MAVAKLQDFRCLFGAQVVDVRFARGFGGASAVVLTSFLPMVQQRADALGWTWDILWYVLRRGQHFQACNQDHEGMLTTLFLQPFF